MEKKVRDNIPEDQTELKSEVEYKPITEFDLQNNEYFDVHSSDLNVSDMTAEQLEEQFSAVKNGFLIDKQKPYKPQLKGKQNAK